MMKLYRVKTSGCVVGGCKDVTFVWFRCHRAPRRYEELIENYDASDPSVAYAVGAIDELFTSIEANALKEYLDQEHGGEGQTVIDERTLPLRNDVTGLRAKPIGGGDGHYMLDREEAYSLPFNVQGYYNLVGCELVNGPGIYHHRLFLALPDGTVRMQTNDEAAATEAEAANRPRVNGDSPIPL
jgi:hypothetical protein